ncbi:MAG TPA: HAMP domain-containing sensor histidine kinase [Actinomycetales bacterium]|nr:HAMP domain-containing sensor histidine kinase [Actinomycetales bacterium]
MIGRPRGRQLGLRAKVTLSFAGGGLALSATLAIGTYLVARNYLVDQRESAALGQGFADASFVREGLLTAGTPVSDVLGTVVPPADSVLLVHQDGEWYSSSLTLGEDVVPPPLVEQVEAGAAGLVWARPDDGAAVVVGVPVPVVGAEFYEVVSTPELERTLDTLLIVLSAFALLTTVGGALLGRYAARRVLAPLEVVAGAAARIAGGELQTRLPITEDPELVTIIGSFNSMVDALAERIERDARFTADVSHELRSPLTTLTTSVHVMQGRRDELRPRAQQALDLMAGELDRFGSVLEDLLELGRLDAGTGGQVRAVVDARELVRHALAVSGRPLTLLSDSSRPGEELGIEVDKQQLNRALVNLFSNADLHGEGLVAVHVRGASRSVVIEVDDGGPGVGVADRDRIFERFVRGGSRGSLPGAGLGLSLVAETLRAHGGSVRCGERPGGGARFSVRLPLAGVGQVAS